MPHGIYPIGLATSCKPNAGKQWEPSNGTEGGIFIESWCGRCQRDQVMNGSVPQDEAGDDDPCQILGASFRGEAKEWQYGQDGQPCCTAYVPQGQPAPPVRCEHTRELPL